MIELGNSMNEFGNMLTNIGFALLPYSFVIYLPARILEYNWNMGYTKLNKALWYMSYGLSYLYYPLGIDTIAIFICFIEGIDLLFQQLEVNRERKLIR